MILEFDPSVPEITATAAVSSRNAKPFDAIELDLAVLWMDAAR